MGIFGGKKTKKTVKKKNSSLSNAILDLVSVLKPDSTDYCDLYTTYDTETIVLDNYSMMSLIKVNGLKTVLTPNQFDAIISNISNDLSEVMSRTGYQMMFLFRRDNFSDREIDVITQRKKQTASRVGLVGLDALIEEDVMIARERVYHEEMYLACVTNFGALDKAEKEINAQAKKEEVPDIQYGQNPFNTSAILFQKHQTFYEHVLNSLSKPAYALSVKRCNIIEALRAIKRQLEPSTAKSWMPKVIIDRDKLPENEYALRRELEGYTLHNVEPYAANPGDASHFMPPPLANQLITEELNETQKGGNAPANTIRYGNKIYSCMSMDSAPTRPRAFSYLFDSLNQFSIENEMGIERLMPYSVCFSIISNAMPSFSMKHMLGGFLKSIPPISNKEIYESLDALKYESEHDVPVVSLQVAFMTWAEDSVEGVNKLRIQKMRLIHAIKNWGGMTVTQNTGDNFLLWQANHLISDKKVGIKTLLPLSEALRLMPFERPSSVFQNASIFYNTVDGKPMGKEIWSPLQPNQFHVITGGAGRGKSVLTNDIMLEHCLQPGLQELPYMLIIDKGASSAGLVSTLKEGLRPEMRHLAEFKELHNSDKTAINPFDIKVGLKFPLPDEVTRLKSFLMALISPANQRENDGLLSNVISMLINRVYKLKERDDIEPFKNGINEELTKILLELDFFSFYKDIPEGHPLPIPDWQNIPEITFYELSERCHKLGEIAEDEVTKLKYYRARDLAHRYAMPRLSDLLAFLTEKEFTSSFGSARTAEQMPLLEYVRQVISSAIEEYPAFSTYTSFDVATSKILSLDLNNVLSITSPKQNSLFLQAALMVGLKKMALTDEDLNKFPETFRAYWTDEWKRLNNLSKVVFIDEFKNGSKDKNFMDAINTGGAEWRKFKIATYLASQHISDFIYNDGVTTINLLKHTTQIFALELPKSSRVNGVSDLDTFKEQYGVEDSIVHNMNNMGLSKDYGSMFFTHIITSESHYNLFLCRKVGNKRLWALNTSPINKAVRAATVAIASSYSEAINALDFNFGASASDDLENRFRQIEDSKESEVVKRQMQRKLMETTAEDTLNNYQQYLAYKRAEENEERRRKYEEDKIKLRNEAVGV